MVQLSTESEGNSTLLREIQNRWSHKINMCYEQTSSTLIDCIRSSVASENLYVTGCQLRRSWSLEYDRSQAEYVSDLRVSSSSSPSCWIMKNNLLVNIHIYWPSFWIMETSMWITKRFDCIGNCCSGKFQMDCFIHYTSVPQLERSDHKIHYHVNKLWYKAEISQLISKQKDVIAQ